MATPTDPPTCAPDAMNGLPSRLALLAGAGQAPERVLEGCRRRGIETFIIAIRGQAAIPDWVDRSTIIDVRLGAVASALGAVQERGIAHICLVGKIRRPSLAELRPDLATAKWLARVGFTGSGDDALLRRIRDALGRQGLTVIAAHELMDRGLLAPGSLGSAQPGDADWPDIRAGWRIAHEIGRLDVGQGVVVQGGIVLAVEAAEGTDAMLARAGELRREGPGGVLVKVPKPQQDRRIDVPTIGAATAAAARQAGLRGIVGKAGATQVIDADGLREAADAAGLFVFGWTGPEGQ